jgi:hypothetical protein
MKTGHPAMPLFFRFIAQYLFPQCFPQAKLPEVSGEFTAGDKILHSLLRSILLQNEILFLKRKTDT